MCCAETPVLYKSLALHLWSYSCWTGCIYNEMLQWVPVNAQRSRITGTFALSSVPISTLNQRCCEDQISEGTVLHIMFSYATAFSMPQNCKRRYTNTSLPTLLGRGFCWIAWSQCNRWWWLSEWSRWPSLAKTSHTGSLWPSLRCQEPGTVSEQEAGHPGAQWQRVERRTCHGKWVKQQSGGKLCNFIAMVKPRYSLQTVPRMSARQAQPDTVQLPQSLSEQSEIPMV